MARLALNTSESVGIGQSMTFLGAARGSITARGPDPVELRPKITDDWAHPIVHGRLWSGEDTTALSRRMSTPCRGRTRCACSGLARQELIKLPARARATAPMIVNGTSQKAAGQAWMTIAESVVVAACQSARSESYGRSGFNRGDRHGAFGGKHAAARTQHQPVPTRREWKEALVPRRRRLRSTTPSCSTWSRTVFYQE